MSTVLVTGANGIVGCEVARVLAREADPPRLVLLVRADDDGEFATKSRWLRDWIGPSPASIEILRGDVTKPDLGLAPTLLSELREQVTDILHAAASTSFHQTPEQGNISNVVGTRNALTFARQCRRFARFGLVSTVYVAGRAKGAISEEYLDLEAGFCNEYEHSKALAEIEALKTDLPIAIYRLSIVVGRRTDGRISRMTGVYPVWRILHEGLLSVLPGDMDQHIDLVPIDFASEAIVHLQRRAFVPGRRYHVAAGPERSLSMREFLSFGAEYIGRAEPSWAQRGYPLPAEVDASTFDDFAETTELVAHRSLRAVVRQIRTFSQQLAYPKQFSTRQFDAELVGSGLHLEHARAWLEPIVATAHASGWKVPGWESLHGSE